MFVYFVDLGLDMDTLDLGLDLGLDLDTLDPVLDLDTLDPEPLDLDTLDPDTLALELAFLVLTLCAPPGVYFINHSSYSLSFLLSSLNFLDFNDRISSNVV